MILKFLTLSRTLQPFIQFLRQPRVYYCSKKDNITEENHEKQKEVESTDKTNRCNVLFEKNSEEILNIVATEKAKEATARSRLAKECNTMREKRVIFLSTSIQVKDICNVERKSPSFEYVEPICYKKPIFPKTPSIESHKKDKGNGMYEGASTPPGRIVRGEPGKVVLGFLPFEWVIYFLPKTGATGFFTFLFTTTTFLISKEFYVMEHNYYNGLSMFILCWASVKYVGPHVALFIDREVDQYEKEWNAGRVNEKKILEEQIEDEKIAQFQFEGQVLLIDAKRIIIQMQLEHEFRLRQLHVMKTVKKYLEYHLAVDRVNLRIRHKNLVQYVTKEVVKALTPQLHKEIINYSIDQIVKEIDLETQKKAEEK